MRSFEISVMQEETVKKPNDLVIGIIVAVIVLGGSASILPLVDEYKEVGVFLRTIWRWQLLVIYCFPCSLYYFYLKRDDMDVRKIFTVGTCVEFLASAILWTIASVLFVWSSEYTLVSHSGLLGNLGGVFIVFLNFVRCLPVHRLEIIGAIVMIIFAIIFVNDNSSTKTNGHTNILFGDIISLCSAPLYGIYYMVSARLLQKLPSMVILQVSFTIQLIMNLIFYICFMDTENFYSFDPHFGFFGWASDTYLVYSLVFVGTFTGLVGVGGYVFILNFFPPHIVGSILLMEPVLAQILGCILGQDNMPGFITYLGCFGITVGLGISIKGDLEKSKKQIKNSDQKCQTSKLDEEKPLHSSLILSPEGIQ
ncbi:unnamed protein product [Moneuplotes crassus]|uniref:EamA domain-containing protein n=1 Tax=Euplotes crassus TaxID=5936 RepID=A0AAD1XFH6_EUPCR|nr:unnamed protein product [Moneuplotes crassus]